MKLEVGKKYLNRLGDVVEIVCYLNEQTTKNPNPFMSRLGTTFTPTGRMASSYIDSDYDLVSEVVETPAVETPCSNTPAQSLDSSQYIVSFRDQLARDLLLAAVRADHRLFRSKDAFYLADEFIAEMKRRGTETQ